MTVIATSEPRGGITSAGALVMLVVAVLAVLVLATFRDYGISWDEELHVPYGEKLLAYYASGFADRSAFAFINLYQYGGFFDLLAAVATTISPFGVYETRHLLGGLFFLVGLVGAWRLACLLAGPRAGLIAVLCLATTPVLYGHSFINPKDAPLAWLGVWVAYFACRLLGGTRTGPRSIIGLGICLGLALGTRIIAFAFVAQIGAVLAVKMLARFETAAGWLANANQMLGLARPFLWTLPLAVLLMAFTWPWSVQSPSNILSVFRESANQLWNPAMLWAGEIVTAADLPPGYLAVLLAVTLPEYVLVGTLAAAVFGAAWVRPRPRAVFAAPNTLAYIYVASTVIVPLAAFALWRPSTYNGLRHFLFVVPQLVVLAAVGLDHLLGTLLQRRRAAGLAFAALLAGAMAYQTLTMVRLHPYQYLGFNSLAGGLAGAYGRFELDYWGVSYGEAARGLAAFLENERVTGREAPVPPRLFVCGANTSAAYFLPASVAITDDRAQADFFLGGDLTNPRCRSRPRGPAIVEVKRDGAVLSYVLDLREVRP